MRLVAQWLSVLLCSWVGSAGAAADCSGSFVINSPDDVTTLNRCTTFTGNVSVAAKGIENVTLNGLRAVTGTIRIADSDAVLSISSTTLESISTLTLSNLPKLTTLTLPALTNFSKLDFTGLTSLKECEIATGALKHDVREISIINTALEKMDWLRWPVATALTIATNMQLTDFTLPYDKISAGSTYQFSLNNALTNLDFSQLTAISGSLAVNNNKDPSMNFDKLETIDGYVRLSGPFSNMTMPNLASINGALRAESTGDILAFCNWLSVQNQFYGHYDCTANNTYTYPEPSVPSAQSKSPSTTAGLGPSMTASSTWSEDDNMNHNESGLSTGAIIGIAVAMVVLISVILTTIALLFFRRRSRNRKVQQAQQAQQAQQTQQAQEAQQAAAICKEKKTCSTSTLGEELNVSGKRYELGGRRTTHELPGSGPVTELDGQTLQELECAKPYFRDHKPAPESPLGRFELP